MDSDDRTLKAISDDELLRRLAELISQSRRVEADLVAHVGEVDERRLFARSAFPSMFAYCTEGLHLSEAEAYRRITVARAARRYPELLTMLRDGRLHLSGLARLVPLLTDDNREGILRRATHLTMRQIEQLVAELAPRPAVPSVIRKLPQPRWESGGPAGEDVAQAGLAGDQDPDEAAASQLVARRVGKRPGPDELPVVPAPTPEAMPAPTLSLTPTASSSSALSLTSARPGVVEPLSPARYKVQFTASAELRDKIERLTALMRSEVPDGDLAAIIERAVTEKLERLEARRFGKSAAPKKPSDAVTSAASRYIPAAVRRAVHLRDGGRCRFVDEEGRRCSERHRLEFHHRRPYGMGGDNSPANISLLCATHNRLLAEHDYGRTAIIRQVSERGRVAAKESRRASP
jgi:hypothetical protein